MHWKCLACNFKGNHHEQTRCMLCYVNCGEEPPPKKDSWITVRENDMKEISMVSNVHTNEIKIFSDEKLAA